MNSKERYEERSMKYVYEQRRGREEKNGKEERNISREIKNYEEEYQDLIRKKVKIIYEHTHTQYEGETL